MATAWFTSANAEPRVLLQIGSVESPGSKPRLVDDQDPVGRPDVAVLDDGTVLVSWIGRGEGEQASLRLQAFPVEGSAMDALDIAPIEGSRRSGFPKLTTDGTRAWLAWTERSEPPRIRCVRIQ